MKDSASRWLYLLTGAALVLTSCQIPLILVVANETTEEVQVELQVALPNSDYCLGPRHSAFMPASHVGRRFREPKRSPARGIVFDSEACIVRCTIPPHEALELEFDPLVGDKFHGSGVGAALVIKGSAGTVSLSGPQVVRHLSEASRGLLYEYGE